jgi:alcohol dehydrogenase class IV
MTNQLSGSWNYPTNIVFGPGEIKKLKDICLSMNITKPLLITDSGLKDSDIVKSTLKLWDRISLFADVKPNPTGKNVEKGVIAYKEGGHDGVIAFGGGSGIDAAKAIALMVGQEAPLWDFEDKGDNWRNVKTENIAPVIAVPTTAGTGSEVGRASVITNEDIKEKKIIFHPTMLPGKVIADPELTIGLPANITAATGMDAFVHCFEAFCAPGYHPMADGIALEGMRLINKHIERAYLNGKDIEARANMLIASTMGATAFQKGLGGVHALAHPLGAIYDKHHGLLNAILLPYVMIKNKKAIEEKMSLLARVLELNSYNFDAVLSWVLEIRKTLDIPNNLSEINIHSDESIRLGALAVKDPSAGGNPIKLSADEYEEVFLNAVNGNLNMRALAA